MHHLLSMVEITHLVELLLQCYYVVKFEQQSSILGCLTDLNSWHYIKLRRNRATCKLEVGDGTNGG